VFFPTCVLVLSAFWQSRFSVNCKLPFVLSTHVCSKRFCSLPVNPPTVLSIERAVCRRVWRSSECASELAPLRICPASRSLPLVQGHPQPPLGVRGAPRLVPVRPLPGSPPGHTSTCTQHETVAGCTVVVHSSFPGPRPPVPHERANSASPRGGGSRFHTHGLTAAPRGLWIHTRL
jgi:hypothetical protein